MALASPALPLHFDHPPRHQRDGQHIPVMGMAREGLQYSQRQLGVPATEKDRRHHCGCYTIAHSLASLPFDVKQQRARQRADALHAFSDPADFSPAGTLAPALPAKVDGRAPLLFHPIASVSRPLNCCHQSRKADADAGNLSHRAEIFSKFGKGSGRGYGC